jgi:hypothetical protein
MEEDAAAVRAAALRGAVSRGAAPSATAEASHIEAARCIEAERSFEGVVTTAVVTTPAPAILTTSIAAAAITAAESIAAAPCIGAAPCIAAERLPEAEQDEEFVLLITVADVVADIQPLARRTFSPCLQPKASCIPGKSARRATIVRDVTDNPTAAQLSRVILKPSPKRRWVQWV